MVAAGRIEYLDVMRASLMLLGVALHASQIYNPGTTWLIHGDGGSTFFYHLSYTIGTFRMPAFFFLSGLLSMMLVLRMGARTFLVLRLRRIALPLLATALTLNVLQYWLLNRTNWIDAGFSEYFLHGEWVQHLWFLINLLVYVCVLTLVAMLPGVRTWCRHISAALGRVPFPAVLAALPLLSIFLIALGKTGLPIYTEVLGVTSLIILFHHLSFFIVGCFVYTNAEVFEKFTSQRLPFLLLWAALALALDVYVGGQADSLVKTVAATYLRFSIMWLCICFFLRVFRMLVRRITPRWQFLCEASYTVYLFHHIVVVSLGIVFIELDVPAPIGFALIVPGTLVITFWLHRYLISRYRALSLLFNGRAAASRAVRHIPPPYRPNDKRTGTGPFIA